MSEQQCMACEPIQPEPSVNFTAGESNRQTMESLTIQEIEKLLDDMKVDPLSLHQNQNNQFISNQIQQSQISIQPTQQELKIQDIVISQNQIIFGELGLVPGAIQQADFSVTLNFKEVNQTIETSNLQQEPFYILRIIALCKNEQFENLDEYVFSVRSNNSYDYYEEIRFKIKRGERAEIKVAVKIPELQISYAIRGMVQIRLQNLEPVYIPLLAKCVVPEIICQKYLYKQDQNISVIKIPAKKCQQRTPPIPFKNLSPYNLSIELQTISNQNFNEKPYDIVPQSYVGCHGNSQFFVSLQLRENMNYTGKMPSKLFIRKILILKIKNSSSIFHFPIEVQVYEGQTVQGN